MSGVKGRSGRRPTSVSEKRLATIDKAWALADQIINNPRADKFQKFTLIKEMISKSTPQEIKGDGFGTIINIQNIKTILEDACRIVTRENISKVSVASPGKLEAKP